MGDNSPASKPGLKPALRTRDVWALGVGIVVCGQYFVWNLALEHSAPVPMLIGSLLVCLLFLGWVLLLAELTVAIPTAGGPLDYGERAAGPWMGFLLGWSMLLECVFGGIATALASGEYVAFLIDPHQTNPTTVTTVALVTVGVFFLIQAWGVEEQARTLIVMTCAALGGLVVFWITASTNFSWPRFWTPTLQGGTAWSEIAFALPFALWWLIIIEGAALAAEESHRADRSIPRGLTLAVLTVVGLVVLTVVTATGAMDGPRIAKRDNTEIGFPLAEVIGNIPAGQSRLIFYGFGVIALTGLVASYHGLLYASSRQLLALGRAGYLPRWLGTIHPRRQTPTAALIACSVVTVGFVIANLLDPTAIKRAVLTAGFAALVLYLGSVVCLLILRSREPGLFHRFRAPLPRLLAWLVLGLSALILIIYPRVDIVIVPVSVGLYALGFGCFWWVRRAKTQPRGTLSKVIPVTRPSGWIETLAAGSIVALLVALTWLVFADVPSWLMLTLIGVTLLLVGVVAWRHTRPDVEKEVQS